MSHSNMRDILRLRRIMKHTQEELDIVILAEPTGNIRNTLTEINIDMLASIEKLNKVAAGVIK